ncbi:flagellar export chaperone FliS [Botrimarina hoheduenensis]|uniref:Flagellar protein FliS n=1 Tax=Botrimarina hoheduenensis TaxID=2528000 RepID=A0A5C5VVS2_9BACT|nr:flagellar export chaperone FliS [Botrimarina hoheduenensis]TWT42698.1 Flagellar protein FliS [Botrimarina hoheduenensis]
MSTNLNREYLEARVQTANSAQLHLMLLDGALRFGREAEKAVLRQDELAAHPALMRTLDIVEELLVGVKDQKTDLNAKLAKLYEFVYARLTSVYVNLDKQLMADALRVLEFQRETWRQACEKLTTEARDESAAAKPATKTAAPKPHLGGSPVTTPGLTLEA